MSPQEVFAFAKAFARTFARSFAKASLLLRLLVALVRFRIQEPERMLDDRGARMELLHVRDANLEVLLVGPEDLERSSGRQEPSVLAQGVPFELGHDILGELVPLMA